MAKRSKQKAASSGKEKKDESVTSSRKRAKLAKTHLQEEEEENEHLANLEEEHQQDDLDHKKDGGELLGKEKNEVEDAKQEAGKAVDTTTTSPALFVSDGRYRNKQRCLVLSSRGVTARYRHLLEDLMTVIPHHKKESKLDPGKDGISRAIEDIAEIRGCNTVLFLECRKHMDAYMWIGRVGGASSSATGPSVRFHMSNIHTMDELRLTGNCMKGSRPVLCFDESFDRLGHLKLIKELFTDVFGTPRGHPKSKPFVDRVMSFFYADRKIWVRNYQIQEQQPENALEAKEVKRQMGSNALPTALVEIGPRFVLNPIRIFRGSFRGQTLFRNPHFVSPNTIRAEARRVKGQAYSSRKQAQQEAKQRKSEMVLPEDPLDSVFR